jgi:hypothetical protein
MAVIDGVIINRERLESFHRDLRIQNPSKSYKLIALAIYVLMLAALCSVVAATLPFTTTAELVMKGCVTFAFTLAFSWAVHSILQSSRDMELARFYEPLLRDDMRPLIRLNEND